MVKRVVVILEQDEYSALLDMAMDDLRNPSDELRHILRLEIERRMSHSVAIGDKTETESNIIKEYQS
jgi:hypothetical protein